MHTEAVLPTINKWKTNEFCRQKKYYQWNFIQFLRFFVSYKLEFTIVGPFRFYSIGWLVWEYLEISSFPKISCEKSKVKWNLWIKKNGKICYRTNSSIEQIEQQSRSKTRLKRGTEKMRFILSKKEKNLLWSVFL